MVSRICGHEGILEKPLRHQDISDIGYNKPALAGLFQLVQGLRMRP